MAGGGEVDRAALVVYLVGEQTIIDNKRGKKTAERISLLSRM